MTVPQLVYETLANDIKDAASIAGVSEGDIHVRRQLMLKFLETSEWDEQLYTAFYLQQMDLMLRKLHNLELPSTAQMAKNLLHAVKEHVSSGWSKCTEEESAERFEVCSSCERMREDKRCSLCGCFMELKSTWKEQKCPIGKW